MRGFYYAARVTLIHHEGHLDAFDRAFLAEYGDLDWDTSLTEQLREWLDEQSARLGRDCAETRDARRHRVARDVRAAQARADRSATTAGRYWIGTGGKSPLGQAGSAERV